MRVAMNQKNKKSNFCVLAPFIIHKQMPVNVGRMQKMSSETNITNCDVPHKYRKTAVTN